MADTLSPADSSLGTDLNSTPASDVPAIIITAADCFNYAAWQNSVPLLRGLAINNESGAERRELRLELATVPPFARPRQWQLQRVAAGELFRISDTDLELDPEYLEGLNEAERGVLKLRLYAGDELLTEAHHPVRMLARDEWGGMSTMGELLAAFVTPNDPALAKLLKRAESLLSDYGHAPALDGYQSEDPNRAYMLAAALWSAVAELDLTYANPPTSFEQVGQKTRRVGTVLSDGLATCLDSTLLFASAIEAVGLNPIIVMTQGHCFVGVWLVKKTLHQLIEPDCSELRKAIVARELITFETTLITQRPPAGFPAAVATAAVATQEAAESKFVAAIDIARARMAQLRPLASHAASTAAASDTEVTRGPLPLPPPPNFGEQPAKVTEERPTTPAGRIDRWQRKLLDLSLRNRLLNFRTTKQTIPVLCPNVSELEDRLAGGGKLRLISLADHNPHGERDAVLHQQRTQQDLDVEFARQALDRSELACPLGTGELESRLTTLFRTVKNDLAEGGTNTLYLAVGFLKWRPVAEQQKTYRAPLLLVPVKLLRRSASSPFYLAHHEDEVRFNATLLQLLKKDFACDIRGLESDLPRDDSGVDVPRVLDRMRREVRDIPGFEVVDETAISTFSFAKYLMWKDLVDRVGQLEKNRVVRHLIHEPDQPFRSGSGQSMPRPGELDVRYSPQDLVHPLPADSSQLAAVMAAAEGHDLVLVGPPGTGKSQTIANLIAQCLSVGKTVLFVAEKTAALDVVHRRLREHGLGDCCVELHSSKAERRRFLDQLETSWNNNQQVTADDWLTVSQRLRIRRDELNTYVTAIHATHLNGWTAYQAMGLCVQGRDLSAPELPWPTSLTHDRGTYESCLSAIRELALATAAVSGTVDLQRVQRQEWSMAWEKEFLETCRRLEQAAEKLTPALDAFLETLGTGPSVAITSGQLTACYRFANELVRPELPAEELLLHERLEGVQKALLERQELLKRREAANQAMQAALAGFGGALGIPSDEGIAEGQKRPFYRLANELMRPELPPAELVFHNQFDQLEGALSERRRLIELRDQADQAIEGRSFNHALIARIQLSTLNRDWTRATKSFWPFSVLRKRAIAKKLQTYMVAGGAPDPDVDLPLLSEHQETRQRLADNLTALGLTSPLQAKVEHNPAGLDSSLQAAQRLRDAIQAAGRTPAGVSVASHGVFTPLIEAARQLYPAGKAIDEVRITLRENLAAIELSPELQVVVEAVPTSLEGPINLAQRLRNAAKAVGGSDEVVADVLRSSLRSPAAERQQTAGNLRRCAKAFQSEWLEYTRLATATPAPTESTSIVVEAAAQAKRVLGSRTQLKQWTGLVAARRRAEALGLGTFVEVFQSGELAPADAVDRFTLAYARWWLPIVMDETDSLRRFQRFQHEEAIADFRRLDQLARRAAAPWVRRAIAHGLPASDQVPRKSELGLLRHQMGLKRPSRSIRELISGMPEAFPKLAPCLLMSPLSIAQYLPADQALFDVVVFDEASQIATWDAIGAIARGKQTIIVGDPKQLPPTNFFGRADDDQNNDELEDFEKDLESILDEAQASGLPTLQLNWHYRSRHESLIAFSNWHYYGNNLVTFPSAETLDRGVSLRLIKGALYDRGKSRTNRQEAEAIVAEAVERMTRCLARPEAERLTYGVITFNSQQQSLIQDFFDQALRDRPELEWFFADERIEPTAVKNLENVQGDERDVMLFSMTFGFDAAGKFPVDFGALNREGGERRLNVAVTRARQQLQVFTSFHPDQLRAERSQSRGVRDLKAFLEYADQGPIALAAHNSGSVGSYESPFEEAVSNSLQARGWRIDPQVGVSGFRVDLGVVHPDKPGVYLAGVECDGATYHRSAVARDRDQTRQQVLENLGWRILRVWSPDWWYDHEAALERVHQELNALLLRGRALVAAE